MARRLAVGLAVKVGKTQLRHGRWESEIYLLFAELCISFCDAIPELSKLTQNFFLCVGGYVESKPNPI